MRMETDFGIIAFILGITNVLVSVVVAVFDFFLEGKLKWLLHPLIELFLNLLGMILFILALVFGIVGIKKGSSRGIVSTGIVLGCVGCLMIGAFFMRIYFF